MTQDEGTHGTHEKPHRPDKPHPPDESRAELENQIAALHEVGWDPERVKAHTFHVDEVSGAYQFEEAQEGDETVADCARRVGARLDVS